MTNDRRNFIKKSVLAGAGLGLFSNQILSAEKENSQLELSNKNEPKSVIRMAFIGVGLRGEVHLEECIKRKDVQVIAICDPDKNSAIPRAKKSLENTMVKKIRLLNIQMAKRIISIY